ncbi:uncharacterized protein LOC119142404 [Falco rusticolus]|uniref:uncharacterized protein LOC119142404 n=1 Tax=Falco rusticolus TaxID=120794 RepID=UPI001886755E|nr:uncharacterized protein LOC119142404 [Falco rusticolus]
MAVQRGGVPETRSRRRPRAAIGTGGRPAGHGPGSRCGSGRALPRLRGQRRGLPGASSGPGCRKDTGQPHRWGTAEGATLGGTGSNASGTNRWRCLRQRRVKKGSREHTLWASTTSHQIPDAPSHTLTPGCSGSRAAALRHAERERAPAGRGNSKSFPVTGRFLRPACRIQDAFFLHQGHASQEDPTVDKNQ